MISKIERVDDSFVDKINELIDAVNEFQKILHDVIKETAENMSWVDTLQNTVLELRAKVKGIDNEPTENPTISKMENVDLYAKYRKWAGKLCRFWDENKDRAIYDILEEVIANWSYQFKTKSDYVFDHCEPVKPDDDIIYRGE